MSKKTDKRLLLALVCGNCSATVPAIALGYGIAQFKFVSVAGNDNAVAAFSISHGLLTLLLIGILPLTGRLVDKFPWPGGTRYYWTILGNLCGLIALHAFVMAQTSAEILIAWLCIVVSYNISGSAFKTAAPELISSHRLAVDSGLIGALTPLCLTINLVFVLGIFADSQLSTKLYLMGAMQLVLSLVGVYIISSYHRHRMSVPPDPLSNTKNDVKYFSFLQIVTAKVFLNIAVSGTSVVSLYYVARFALTEESVFTLNAWMALGVLLILMTGAGAVYLANRHHAYKFYLVVGAVILATGLATYAVADALWVAIIAGVLIQLGLGPVYALSTSLINIHLPDNKHYARDLALVDAAQNAGAAIIHFLAPFIIGFGLADDGYALYFLFLMTSALIFAFIMGFLKTSNAVVNQTN